MVSASNFQNRRMSRVSISRQIIGKLNTFQRYSFSGKSINISHEGICFESSINSLEVGQNIKLATNFYDGDYLFKATGNIRWMNKNDDFPGSTKMGVRLIKINNYDKWCRKVDTALAFSRLHDIPPVSGSISYLP